MKDLTITQEYFLCVLNEDGKLPVFGMDTTVCLLVGGLIDLLLAKSLEINKDKSLHVVGDLGEKHLHLNSLYTFIKESKPMKADKIVTEYMFTFSDKRIKQLIYDVGTSLDDIGCVSAVMGGVFGNTRCFILDKQMVDRVIQAIRVELLEDGTMSESIVALVSLLNKSNQIKKYFSKYENDQLKARLKEIKATDFSKLTDSMVDFIDTIICIIAASGAGH